MPKLKTKLKQQEFYCVSCRQRVTCHKDDIGVIVFKNEKRVNGKVPALRSQCPKCETAVTKFIKSDDEYKLTKKYGVY